MILAEVFQSRKLQEMQVEQEGMIQKNQLHCCNEHLQWSQKRWDTYPIPSNIYQ